MEKKINLIVKEIVKNVRVDVFISNNENDLSRSRIKNLILGKKLKINNKIVTDPAKKISDGDHIVLIIPEPKKASLKPSKDPNASSIAVFKPSDIIFSLFGFITSQNIL